MVGFFFGDAGFDQVARGGAADEDDKAGVFGAADTLAAIGQVVDAWKSIPFVEGDPPGGAPRKARAMLRDNTAPLGEGVNFTDIGNAVDAWKTIAYREAGPASCP